MCKNRDFALYGLWRPYKATKSYFFGIINVWGSSLGSRRNLHIGFIMGCRGGFSRKMQKTGGGEAKIAPPPNETRVKRVMLYNFITKQDSQCLESQPLQNLGCIQKPLKK